jgi:hypothetical protein
MLSPLTSYCGVTDKTWPVSAMDTRPWSLGVVSVIAWIYASFSRRWAFPL